VVSQPYDDTAMISIIINIMVSNRIKIILVGEMRDERYFEK